MFSECRLLAPGKINFFTSSRRSNHRVEDRAPSFELRIKAIENPLPSGKMRFM
jgi:hypothetical protein